VCVVPGVYDWLKPCAATYAPTKTTAATAVAINTDTMACCWPLTAAGTLDGERDGQQGHLLVQRLAIVTLCRLYASRDCASRCRQARARRDAKALISKPVMERRCRGARPRAVRWLLPVSMVKRTVRTPHSWTGGRGRADLVVSGVTRRAVSGRVALDGNLGVGDGDGGAEGAVPGAASRRRA